MARVRPCLPHCAFLLVLFLAALATSALGEVCSSSPCVFTWDVRWSRTMVYRSTETRSEDETNYLVVESNDTLVVSREVLGRQDGVLGDTISPDDVITADGNSRDVITINGQFPGPTLEVMEGVEVVVHVTNHMATDALTVHWHGIHQIGTYWMDGSPWITQCPVAPGQTFTYRFKASPGGTHWYHSHLGNQRQDGLYGALIIHRAAPAPAPPQHLIQISDWYEHPGNFLNNGIQDKHSVLINGKGWPDFTGQRALPLTTFEVASGTRQLFRTIHCGVNFGYEVSIDEHQLTIVASDGYNVQPFQVDSFFIYPGETIDFELDTVSVNTSRYWVRVEEFKLEETIPVAQHQKRTENSIGYVDINSNIKDGRAVLKYNGNSASNAVPSSIKRPCDSANRCVVFNCPGELSRQRPYMRCINYDSVKGNSCNHLWNELALDKAPDNQQTLNFITSGNEQASGSSINGRKFIAPARPLVEGAGTLERPCNGCLGCSCTNIIDLDYDNVVDLIVTNVQGEYNNYAHHPVHLHGHSFAVLYMGHPVYNNTLGLRDAPELSCHDPYCDTVNIQDIDSLRSKYNTHNPPIKDTLLVPAKGFAVLRIRVNNPGYWLMHCHVTKHFLKGMGVLLNAAPGHHMPVPGDFPGCYGSSSTSNYMSSNGDNTISVYPWMVVLFAFGMIIIGVLLVSFTRCLLVGNKKRTALI